MSPSTRKAFTATFRHPADDQLADTMGGSTTLPAKFETDQFVQSKRALLPHEERCSTKAEEVDAHAPQRM